MPARFKPAAAALCLVALLGVGLSATARAEEQQTITVTVVGEAQAMPDTLHISGKISENSEKMKDAVTAFRDTHRRTLASIEALKLDGLAVATKNLSISVAGDPQMANQFGIEQAGEPKQPGSLTISQEVHLTLGGLGQLEEPAVIDLVVKLMEGAKEAGIEQAALDQAAWMRMQYGMGEMATAGNAVFKLSDPAALRQQAMKDAVQKARADALALAELAGAKLGGVVSITDSGGAMEGMSQIQMWYGMQQGETEPFTTHAYQPIKTSRPLSVTFRLITE